MYPVCVLLDGVPLVLVERRQVPGPRRIDAELPLDHRFEGIDVSHSAAPLENPCACLPNFPCSDQLHTKLAYILPNRFNVGLVYAFWSLVLAYRARSLAYGS